MGLMKKLTSAIVASSLVLSLVGTAFAAYTPAAGETAGNRMQTLGIVQGKPAPVGLDLNGEITRAELVTVIVRAFGQADNAKLLVGAAAYPDTAKHWASGNIAMAKALIEKNGETMGMPDGTFAPDAKLTPAQAVAFLMKFLGVKADAAKTWPANYLDAAVKANIIAADDSALIAPMLNNNATRGLVFYMFDRAFYTYDLGAGKTFYTKYVDPTAPVINLTAVEPTTLDSKVTVSGKIEGAIEAYVGTTKVTLDASGNFSSDFQLPEMKEYKVVVTAMDLAGNKAEKTVTVTRTVGNVAAIEAAAITVAAGATVDVAAVAKDAKGNTVKDVAITGTSTVGTFEAGKFTAATKAGTGTLTLKTGEITKEVTVTVTAGALDKIVPSAASAAPGEKVTLSATDAHGNAITGVTYTQTSADALLDGAQGVFIASKAGNYTVTGKVGTVEKSVTIGVYSTTVAKYSVTASANNVIANNASTIELTVRAIDANGNLVANEPTTARKTTLTSSSFEKVNTDGTGTALNAFEVTLKNGEAKLTVRTVSGELGGKIAQIFTEATSTATTSTTAAVTLVDQVATSISVENDDVFLPSNATDRATTFKVKVLDQAGKPMLTGFYAVDTTLTGAGAVILNGDNTAKTAKKVYVSNKDGVDVVLNPSAIAASGTATLTAAATGLTSGSDSVTVQMPGPAAKLVLTADKDNKATPKANKIDAVKYTVKVTDAAGVAVSATPTVNVEFPDLTDKNWTNIEVKNGTGDWTALSAKTTAVTITGGVGEFQVRAAKYTGALNFQVKDTATSGALAAPAGQTVTFKADVPAKVAFTVNGVANKGSVSVSSANTALTIVAQLYDGADNKTASEGAKIKLVGAAVANTGALGTDVVINSVDADETVTADANGAATFAVTTANFVGAQYTLTATATYVDSNGATQDANGVPASNVAATTVTVANNIAAGVSVSLFSDINRTIPVSTVAANADTYVRVTVTDNAGRKLSGESLKVSAQNADGTWSEVTGLSVSTSAGAGLYDFVLKPTVAPSVVYKVETRNSAPVASAQFSIGVRPDTTAAKLTITGGAAQEIGKNVVKAFTVNVADTHGNTIVNNTGSAYTVTLNFGGIPAGKLVQVRSTADGLAISSQALNATTATAEVTIAAGAPSVTFYVVTDINVNGTFTMTAADNGTGTGTFVNLTDLAAVTFTVK